MVNKLNIMKLTKEQILDFIVLSLRWYLAYYMFNYGLSKINGEQFGNRGLTILNTPLKDVTKFDLAWHLFSLDRTFDIVVGIVQIIGALLIIFNKTLLIGALLLIPILVQIFLIDITFTMDRFGAALPIRLSFMMFSNLFILFYYKDKMILLWHNLTKDITTKFKYRWWVFIFMPLIGLCTDFFFGILSFPIKKIISWLMY